MLKKFLNHTRNINTKLSNKIGKILVKLGVGMQGKLITIFLIVQVIPLILLTVMAWQQINILGDVLREIAVNDSSKALNDSAVENIERLSTDAANKVADFLYGRDRDILYLAGIDVSEKNYQQFAETQNRRVVEKGNWELAEDKKSWVYTDEILQPVDGGKSTNEENNDRDGFHYRSPETFEYTEIPLYDEIAFIDLDGMEVVKYVAPNSSKKNYPMNIEKRDISKKENTYVKAETYFEEVQKMKPGEIYVSDVTGAYVGSNYIGMYAPEVLEEESNKRGYDIEYNPEEQAYAGEENPNGQRFEGIVRWATPAAGENGDVVGYVTFALNHDHIMEIVDHLTPMNERYTHLPSAYEGNYAFIWDYKCRSIVHPRHHSIVGFDPETGEPEVPWLETSIYEGWLESDDELWTDYVKHIPTFDEQSRKKKPAAELTKAGLVGLDGRYLNNAPQCTGWMDLTREGGSGSFYILWSGIYKLNTAAAIPYYTGQYAPSEKNEYSKRGFGFVAVGAGLEDFTRPATETGSRLSGVILGNQDATTKRLTRTSMFLIFLMILIAIWVASSITGNIKQLIHGISHFKAGERQFRFDAEVKDEFGTLADSFDDMADSIVDSVKNPLSIIDMDYRIIYMNQQGLDFCNMTLEEIVGTSYSENSIYPSESEYDPMLALKENRESEIYFEKNSNRYLKGKANYLLNKDGECISYIIETDDVTEMVLEQMKIQEQKSLLDKIFSSSPDLVWYVDINDVYFTVNPRFASIAGKSVEDFQGKTAAEMLPTEIARNFVASGRKAVDLGKPVYSEEIITFADGHTETLDSVLTPIYDTAGEGSLVGLLGFARDVSIRVSMEDELRKTQIDLEKAVEDANRANDHKGEFLARMSHEIRTPMNAIVGITNIVQRKLEDGVQSELNAEDIKYHVDQIEDSSKHLLGLLNDILDISKIEAGKIDLLDEAVEISKLANTVVNIIKPRCIDKNIRFVSQFDSFSPSNFQTDGLRLRQVLINLLGNAVKFTPQGGTIWFSISEKERKPGYTLVNFCVKDTGIGIKEEYQDTIFESFEQASSDAGRQHGGTGLGLAISQRIVNLFGGNIELESTPGEGSDFSFSIWLRESETATVEDVEISDAEGKFKGYHMLLVDDVELNRMIASSLLEYTGIEIVEAENGKKAVELFSESEPGYYDIIIMDIQMPVMNGYDAASAIRKLDHEDAATVPIIALTADAFIEDINKSLSFGMNGHMAKPIEMNVLLENLFRFIDIKSDD